MKKGDEIRGLVREIENRVEAGILPDGNCIFDPLRVRLALEFVLSVLELSLIHIFPLWRKSIPATAAAKTTRAHWI